MLPILSPNISTFYVIVRKPKYGENEKAPKVSFHAQNQSDACQISYMQGKNEVSKQTTEGVPEGNPDLLLFENQKKSLLNNQQVHCTKKQECTCQ